MSSWINLEQCPSGTGTKSTSVDDSAGRAYTYTPCHKHKHTWLYHAQPTCGSSWRSCSRTSSHIQHTSQGAWLQETPWPFLHPEADPEHRTPEDPQHWSPLSGPPNELDWVRQVWMNEILTDQRTGDEQEREQLLTMGRLDLDPAFWTESEAEHYLALHMNCLPETDWNWQNLCDLKVTKSSTGVSQSKIYIHGIWNTAEAMLVSLQLTCC